MHHFLALGLGREVGFLTDRPAADGDLLAVEQARLFEAFCYQRYTAGFMHIGSDEVSARLQIAEQRSADC